MKKRFLALALSAVLLAGALPAYGAPETEPLTDYGTPGVDYVEGEAIVCLDTSRQKTGEAMLQGNGGYQLESLMELDTPADTATSSELLFQSGSKAVGDGSVKNSDSRELILVTAQNGQSTPELIRELEEQPSVVFAEPNFLFQTTDLSGDDTLALSDAKDGFAPEAGQDGEAFAKIEGASGDSKEASGDEQGFSPEKAPGFSPEGADAAASAPTSGEAAGQAGDLTPWQWYLSNRYCPQYTINAAPLYQAGITGVDVVVAVVDSGVDYTHPDLSPQMWDEGLSYPALTALGGGRYGINASTDLTGTPGSIDSTDPMDDMGHGTHCAGIIASAWDGQGTDGVAGGARIMALKVSSPTGFTTSAALKAYRYMKAARESGVNLRVANNSWGSPELTRALHLAVDELGQAGVLSVFASGNDNRDLSHYSSLKRPASLTPNLLQVNAIDYQGEKSPFSCWGPGGHFG